MPIITNHESSTHDTFHLEFEADWTWLELRNKLRTVFARMQQAPTHADLVFDFTHSPNIPEHPLVHFDRLRSYLPANLGTFVLIVPQNDMRKKLMPLCKHYAAKGLEMVVYPTRTEVVPLFVDIHDDTFNQQEGLV
jgi:hypothetical protein